MFANSPHRPDIGFQFRAYQTMYECYKGLVEWFAFFDDDEYANTVEIPPCWENPVKLVRDVEQLPNFSFSLL